jgi:hypothetical protein
MQQSPATRTSPRLGARAALLTVITVALGLGTARTAAAWGERGHTMIGRAAAAGLPAEMPAFFREAADQLAYLNPEPDRWRDRVTPVMDEAFKYDHYIDLENVPDGALEAPDRFTFLETLYDAGVEEPQLSVGFLPYRILELQARLTSGFARWRRAESAEERAWIEQRIINDAGVLGHYVADAAQPHHTTIHFNGWARDADNPQGFTTERDFHYRFETQFVDAHVTEQALEEVVPMGVAPIDDVRSFVLGYIQDSNDNVEALYRIEKSHGFHEGDAAPEALRFTLERMATGAAALRSLWYEAWIDSAG